MNSYPIELRYILGCPVLLVESSDEFYNFLKHEVSVKQIDGKVFPVINWIRSSFSEAENFSKHRDKNSNPNESEGLIRSSWILDVCYLKPSTICYYVDTKRWTDSPGEIIQELDALRYGE